MQLVLAPELGHHGSMWQLYFLEQVVVEVVCLAHDVGYGLIPSIGKVPVHKHGCTDVDSPLPLNAVNCFSLQL